MNYTGQKTFEVEQDWGNGSITVSIDFDKVFKLHPEAELKFTTMDMIKMMVEFWAGWKETLKECDNDYVRCFLMMLAKESFRVGMYHHWNEKGIISYFEEAEGWSNMDGSHGIKIKNFDNLSISFDDLTLKEIN